MYCDVCVEMRVIHFRRITDVCNATRKLTIKISTGKGKHKSKSIATTSKTTIPSAPIVNDEEEKTEKIDGSLPVFCLLSPSLFIRKEFNKTIVIDKH